MENENLSKRQIRGTVGFTQLSANMDSVAITWSTDNNRVHGLIIFSYRQNRSQWSDHDMMLLDGLTITIICKMDLFILRITYLIH